MEVVHMQNSWMGENIVLGATTSVDMSFWENAWYGDIIFPAISGLVLGYFCIVLCLCGWHVVTGYTLRCTTNLGSLWLIKCVSCNFFLLDINNVWIVLIPSLWAKKKRFTRNVYVCHINPCEGFVRLLTPFPLLTFLYFTIPKYLTSLTF